MKACAWFYGDLHAETHIQIAHLKKKEPNHLMSETKSTYKLQEYASHESIFFQISKFPFPKNIENPQETLQLRRCATPLR